MPKTQHGFTCSAISCRLVPISVQLALARQDAQERESRDHCGCRLGESYSPRRHWCPGPSPTEKRGSGGCVQICDDDRRFPAAISIGSLLCARAPGIRPA
jgi:hypothetical protein